MKRAMGCGEKSRARAALDLEPRCVAVGLLLMACGVELVELEPRWGEEQAEPLRDGSSEPSPQASAPGESAFRSSDTSSAQPSPEGVAPAFPSLLPTAEEPPREEEPTGCQKADFLFVVDNSGSMEDKQQALARSFPQFIDTLQDTLQVQDFHLMAVDTDGDRLDELDFPLSANDCDEALGAGRIRGESGQACGITNGLRYVADGQADLAATFSCMAEAGDSGSVLERPVEAALSAISEPLGSLEGCNQGFLREDAILIVVWITDEDDTRSDGDPADWYEALLLAKGDDPHAIVPLALVGPEDDDEKSLVCEEAGLDVDEAPRMHELVLQFETGVVGDICAQDYAAFFLQAVANVVWSCEQFEPPTLR